MKFFNLGIRPKQNPGQIPHVRAATAHLIGPGKLRCQAEHLVFETEGSKQIRLDIEGLKDVLAFGNVSFTADAIRLLHHHGITLSLLNRYGTYLCGSLAQDSSDRALTLLLQFQAYEDTVWQLAYARQTVIDKLASAQASLRHYQRQGKKLTPSIIQQFDLSLESARSASSVEQLRGVEGHAASLWFGEYGKLFGTRWKFDNRNRRPPRDPINSLLSLGYMQLYRRCVSRLEASGYEASLGALHEFRPGRMSLACDLMEPLRIPVVDRWVVGICQQSMVKPHDFDTTAENGVRLKADRLGDILGRFEQWWHQGLFCHILDQQVARFRDSLRERVSSDTSRAAAYLKLQASQSAQAGKQSGTPEVYEP